LALTPSAPSSTRPSADGVQSATTPEPASKLAVVVADGLADRRYAELGGRSPVEYASTPALDALAANGRAGLVRTMYDGLPLGSLVGFLGRLGQDPRRYPALERSALEAKRLGVPVGPRDLVFRCNIVEVADDGSLADFTAGQIDEESAHAFLAGLGDLSPFELHHDYSYRNVLVYRDCPFELEQLTLTEPHSRLGEQVEELLPRDGDELCGALVELMLSSRRGNRMLWPWGPSADFTLPPVRYHLSVVTALGFLYGLAVALGGRAVAPAGATGFKDTDLGAKLAAFDGLLPESDVVIVHCNAPDEESHVGKLEGKVETIEAIDREITGPIAERVAGGAADRILFCTDHYTYCDTRMHGEGPVPFVVAGAGIEPGRRVHAYSEEEIAGLAEPVIPSFLLLDTWRLG
jgi:2,3-bisphosphoglycerate-independent phosphoglycerate mutase